MYKIVVPGQVGAYVGQIIDLPPYGTVKVKKVNMPNFMIKIEVSSEKKEEAATKKHKNKSKF